MVLSPMVWVLMKPLRRDRVKLLEKAPRNCSWLYQICRREVERVGLVLREGRGWALRQRGL